MYIFGCLFTFLAVCLHFQLFVYIFSCLFTSQLFIYIFSCLFTSQLFVYIFDSCLFTFSAVCLHFRQLLQFTSIFPDHQNMSYHCHSSIQKSRQIQRSQSFTILRIQFVNKVQKTFNNFLMIITSCQM